MSRERSPTRPLHPPQALSYGKIQSSDPNQHQKLKKASISCKSKSKSACKKTALLKKISKCSPAKIDLHHHQKPSTLIFHKYKTRLKLDKVTYRPSALRATKVRGKLFPSGANQSKGSKKRRRSTNTIDGEIAAQWGLNQIVRDLFWQREAKIVVFRPGNGSKSQIYEPRFIVKGNESLLESRKSCHGGSAIPDSRDLEQSNKNKETLKRTKNQRKKSNDYRNNSRLYLSSIYVIMQSAYAKASSMSLINLSEQRSSSKLEPTVGKLNKNKAIPESRKSDLTTPKLFPLKTWLKTNKTSGTICKNNKKPMPIRTHYKMKFLIACKAETKHIVIAHYTEQTNMSKRKLSYKDKKCEADGPKLVRMCNQPATIFWPDLSRTMEHWNHGKINKRSVSLNTDLCYLLNYNLLKAPTSLSKTRAPLLEPNARVDPYESLHSIPESCKHRWNYVYLCLNCSFGIINSCFQATMSLLIIPLPTNETMKYGFCIYVVECAWHPYCLDHLKAELISLKFKPVIVGTSSYYSIWPLYILILNENEIMEHDSGKNKCARHRWCTLLEQDFGSHKTEQKDPLVISLKVDSSTDLPKWLLYRSRRLYGPFKEPGKAKSNKTAHAAIILQSQWPTKMIKIAQDKVDTLSSSKEQFELLAVLVFRLCWQFLWANIGSLPLSSDFGFVFFF